jgi:uncharacterized membrane protein
MKQKSFPVHGIIIFLAFIEIASSYTSAVFAQEIPKAQCLSAYGQTKCGYGCEAWYGQIECAEWPGGACEASYGRITCGPPAPLNWLNAYTKQSTSDSTTSGVRGAWAVKLDKWNGIL